MQSPVEFEPCDNRILRLVRRCRKDDPRELGRSLRDCDGRTLLRGVQDVVRCEGCDSEVVSIGFGIELFV